MGENKKNASDMDEKFKMVTVEIDYDSVAIIEELIKQQPELGCSSVEDYLEGLFQRKANEKLEDLKSKKGENK